MFLQKSIKESNNIAVDPTCIVILSVAKSLLLRSYKILHIQLLATLIENLFLMFSLRYGQDDSFAKLIVFGSTAILLPKRNYTNINKR